MTTVSTNATKGNSTRWATALQVHLSARPVVGYKSGIQKASGTDTQVPSTAKGEVGKESTEKAQEICTGCASSESGDDSVTRVESVDIEKEVMKDMEPALVRAVRKALSGKPEKKLVRVFMGLFRAGIDSTDDLAYLAKKLKDTSTVAKWLERETSIPSVSCMRIAHFFCQ